MVEAQQSFEVTLSALVSVEGVTNSAVPSEPPNFPLNGDKLWRWAPITDQLSPKLTGHFRLLNLTYDKAKELEVLTQKQAEYSQWHELRYPRLTASTFGKICSKMEKPRAKPELVARFVTTKAT